LPKNKILLAFPINDFHVVKEKVLNYTNRFSTFSFLDNHGYNIPPHTQECLVACGTKRILKLSAGTALSTLQDFIDAHQCWLFGHLGYDLKNEMEPLTSSHPDPIGFPDLFFFEPAILLRLSKNELSIEADEPERIYREIMESEYPLVSENGNELREINSRIDRNEYISIINRLKQHILRGDCYEINYCLEFNAINSTLDPLETYRLLSAVSPNPFSAFYRMEDKWMICASPERFLKKDGRQILSQPIKGTSTRIQDNKTMDANKKEDLFNSSKDRSENVMVVDLVRNDLAKVCEEGSVKVDELFGIYSFPQVHQMISTVSGKLKKDISFSTIMRATFPMGSMTGAPKRRVMELIEQYEKTRRGIFSGALGYISPAGDFDFNVIIRSIFYNASTRYISFLAGSGITFYSDPEKEWEECLVKAAAMKEVLTKS
jgi:para-aminobenzoate synthetase component 1